MSLGDEIRELAELSATSRAFLSVFLSDPDAVKGLESRLRRMRKALDGEGEDRDEIQILDEDTKLILEYLEKHPHKTGSLCLFSCWLLDFLKVVQLEKPVGDLIWFDSSPYIRPLAEYQDEYETAAVVVADNKRARVFLVSTGRAETPESIKGNVKNHVRKGGWSQQRYERRRDKQLLHYARDIVDVLSGLARNKEFQRILLVGGKEAIQAVEENLPKALKERVSHRAVDLGKPEDAINEDIWELFREQERGSEHDLWEKIRNEYFRGGLGVVGLQDVLNAAKAARIEQMIVNRGFRPTGVRCRGCDEVNPEAVDSCTSCGSDSLYEVDVVNEIVEFVVSSGGEVEFVDSIPALASAGNVAAFLRYQP